MGISIASGITAVPGSSAVGSVTSVAATVPAGMSVAGSPVTSSGTLAITLTGTNKTVMFNDGGGVGSDADFTWDKTTNVLTLGSASVTPFIRTPASAIAATAGVGLYLKPGGGSTSGTGGDFQANAGDGGSTGAGGAARLVGGDGGLSSGAGGVAEVIGGLGTGNAVGGGVNITGGATLGTNKSGSLIYLQSGAASGNADGGGLIAACGDGGPTGGGGNMSFQGGRGGLTSGSGGAAGMQGGTAQTLGNGGSASLVGGIGAGAAGTGGDADVSGGTSATARAGRVYINGGVTSGTNQDGALIQLKPGEKTGSGADGNTYITGGLSGTALATTAKGGFLCIPSCAGTPTGVPSNLLTGTVPIVFDTTGVKLWVYTGGAWKGIVLI